VIEEIVLSPIEPVQAGKQWRKIGPEPLDIALPFIGIDLVREAGLKAGQQPLQ
jgi:hypothetical protein